MWLPGDGACDDGGPGATFTVCDFGTDCSDCGARYDADGDGFYDDEGTVPLDTNLILDCDDTEATTYPGAPEITNDGIDQDCDGVDATVVCLDTCQYANDGDWTTAPTQITMCVILVPTVETVALD